MNDTMARQQDTSEFNFDRNDRGKGSLDDYTFDLSPKRRAKPLRLAGSDPHQDELQKIADMQSNDLVTAIGRRTIEEERTDAPMYVRLFTGVRVSEVVGMIPRGLEAVIEAAHARLESNGKPQRIPVAIIKTRQGYRVELMMGETR